jgi:hypothetical protein
VTPVAPLVALIHATPASMPAAHGAFADRFPDARLWNLLDDRLLPDAAAADGLTEPLRGRMRTLIRHAVDGGADAVLLTCSMFGPVAVEEAGAHPVPVLPSDHGLFEAVRSATTRGARRVTVLGPIRASVDDTVARLRASLAAPDVRIDRVVAGPGTLTDGLGPGTDLVVLGQFSISTEHSAVQDAVPVPVLSPAHLAVDLVRDRLGERAQA